ncbi:MAG: cyclase family protein, partial [bacterium]|nr:cyclase family protein [bacterium]
AYRDLIKKGAFILIKTGWDRTFGSSQYLEAFPCLTNEAAEYLAAGEIALLGMDTPSPGPPGEEGAAIHRTLLGANIVIVESLKNLTRIIQPECRLIVLPIRLEGSGGAPCRAVAVIDN